MESSIASAWKQVCIFFITYRWVIILICLIVFVYACYKKLTDRWEELTNAGKVFYAGLGSIILGFLLLFGITVYDDTTITKITSPGFWNFIILIVSAPVAFAIWHFRDENNKQQIENQRKDINLKEFQKLSEWVSGAHLPEIKTVSKTTQKSSSEDGVEITEQTTEQSEEYAKKPDAADFDTFSKRDGAVALQISAIYNLLPFFRGDYGESFRRPAFNLLKSTWQAMQQDSLKKLEAENLSESEQRAIIKQLRSKATSSMGVALTYVLLSLNRENTTLTLRDFPEMLSNLCLAGMDFSLSWISKTSMDLSNLVFENVDFRAANLQTVNFQNSSFLMGSLQDAILIGNKNLQGTMLFGTNLKNADLYGSSLEQTVLQAVNLQNVRLSHCDFTWEQLKYNSCPYAEIHLNDFVKKIYPEWKRKSDSEWNTLTKGEQMNVIRQFCDQTKILIFDKKMSEKISSLKQENEA